VSNERVLVSSHSEMPGNYKDKWWQKLWLSSRRLELLTGTNSCSFRSANHFGELGGTRRILEHEFAPILRGAKPVCSSDERSRRLIVGSKASISIR